MVKQENHRILSWKKKQRLVNSPQLTIKAPGDPRSFPGMMVTQWNPIHGESRRKKNGDRLLMIVGWCVQILNMIYIYYDIYLVYVTLLDVDLSTRINKRPKSAKHAKLARIPSIFLLVGGWPTPYESHFGWFFLIYGKIKNVPNHQPVWNASRNLEVYWFQVPHNSGKNQGKLAVNSAKMMEHVQVSWESIPLSSWLATMLIKRCEWRNPMHIYI